MSSTTARLVKTSGTTRDYHSGWAIYVEPQYRHLIDSPESQFTIYSTELAASRKAASLGLQPGQFHTLKTFTVVIIQEDQNGN